MNNADLIIGMLKIQKSDPFIFVLAPGEGRVSAGPMGARDANGAVTMRGAPGNSGVVGRHCAALPGVPAHCSPGRWTGDRMRSISMLLVLIERK